MKETDALIAAAFIAAGAAILAAFIAAGAAVWIGWLQNRALREQNRIAAFDKRLAVFKDAQLALSSVRRRGDSDTEAFAAMKRAVQASWFLFPRDVSDRLSKMHDLMVDLSTSMEMLRQQPPSPEHQTHVALKRDSLKALMSELDDLAEFFKPYVSLEPAKPPSRK